MVYTTTSSHHTQTVCAIDWLRVPHELHGVGAVPGDTEPPRSHRGQATPGRQRTHHNPTEAELPPGSCDPCDAGLPPRSVRSMRRRTAQESLCATRASLSTFSFRDSKPPAVHPTAPSTPCLTWPAPTAPRSRTHSGPSNAKPPPKSPREQEIQLRSRDSGPRPSDPPRQLCRT